MSITDRLHVQTGQCQQLFIVLNCVTAVIKGLSFLGKGSRNRTQVVKNKRVGGMFKVGVCTVGEICSRS